MRRPLIVANWKMHGSRAGVAQLLGQLTDMERAAGVEIVVCPSYIHLAQALDLCAGSQLGVGGQDCSHMVSGAYTGEVAAAMLVDLGCRWVILGHSERRQYHAESDQLVAAKLAAAITATLQPIICVGETREQRENGEAQSVVEAQLLGALVDQSLPDSLVIAYEPVWAIGTGLTASPAQAQEMHAFIRSALDQLSGAEPASTRLLYGGSVKPENAAELFAQPDIDGALVGGASLDAADFEQIIRAAG